MAAWPRGRVGAVVPADPAHRRVSWAGTAAVRLRSASTLGAANASQSRTATTSPPHKPRSTLPAFGPVTTALPPLLKSRPPRPLAGLLRTGRGKGPAARGPRQAARPCPARCDSGRHFSYRCRSALPRLPLQPLLRSCCVFVMESSARSDGLIDPSCIRPVPFAACLDWLSTATMPAVQFTAFSWQACEGVLEIGCSCSRPSSLRVRPTR